MRESNQNISNKKFTKSAGFVYLSSGWDRWKVETILLWCFFARIFTLDESFTLKFHFEKSRPGRAAAERQLERVRESNQNISNKRFTKSAGFVYLSSGWDRWKVETILLWCFFARIFTLDESFTLKFHFEKSRPGRAAAERQLPGNLPDCWIAYQ